MLSEEQLRESGDNGDLVLPGVVPEQLLAPAGAQIDALLAESPPPAGAVSNHSYSRPARPRAARTQAPAAPAAATVLT